MSVSAIAVLAGCLLPGSALATTPSSTATCSGSLTPDSSGASVGEPNLLDYSFSCNEDITNYTFVVNRYPDNSNVIDDFESSPTVVEPDGTPSSTETFACAGSVPGNGFNCNAPTGTPMTAGDSSQGSLDPIDPYCKRLPPGAKPGTPAEPQAQVEVIVTDSTGATDGPFILDRTPACPSVPNTVPYPPPPKPKPTKNCRGSVSKDSSPTAKEPNLLDYTFRCDGEVTAYSIVVDRYATRTDNVNAFEESPLVLLPNGGPSPNESFSCTGRLPGLGFNCLAPSGQAMLGGHRVKGSFNPVDPYCKRLPPGAKPGTPAEPQAVVRLLITDATGAQRGPFSLSMKPACAAVPNRVPEPKHKSKPHHHRSRG